MAPKQSDVIAALATPPGRGGVAVIRVSGKNLIDFCAALTQRKTPPTARYAQLADFLDNSGQSIDQGLLIFFPAPHSYTGEDVVELQGHGGQAVSQLLLQRCLELGARLAQPGEFTQRAFLNDKLDLAQAEAVADLIDAQTTAGARAAMRSLSGQFSQKLHTWRDELINLRMLVEATLDFPDEEIDFLQAANAFERLHSLHQGLEKILAAARQGTILRNGLKVVLMGAPNVGKSSLLNQLAEEDRAIVTDIPGTTRDVLREHIQIEGIPLHIIDTAGLRDTSDPVERIGIERTRNEINNADVILRLVEYGASHADDHAISIDLPPHASVIEIINKIDKFNQVPMVETQSNTKRVFLSAKNGEGVDLLKQSLLEIAGWQGTEDTQFIARERHLQALHTALSHLENALQQVHQHIELLAEDLRLAQEAVNSITGEFLADDLLGVIFSRFCIGK